MNADPLQRARDTAARTPRPLAGRVAVVAGATRGAGRGIAAALGEAGATRCAPAAPDIWRYMQQSEQGRAGSRDSYR